MKQQVDGNGRLQRKMKQAICNYWRASGKGCRNCKYSGTKQCLYANNPPNEELLKA